MTDDEVRRSEAYRDALDRAIDFILRQLPGIPGAHPTDGSTPLPMNSYRCPVGHTMAAAVDTDSVACLCGRVALLTTPKRSAKADDEERVMDAHRKFFRS